MARPKRGEPGSDRATSKWRATMLAKYGGEEGLNKKMKEIGRKGGMASTNGGFASDKIGPDGLTGRERARRVGKIGGMTSRRTGVKNYQGKSYRRPDDIDKAAKVLEEENGRD